MTPENAAAAKRLKNIMIRLSEDELCTLDRSKPVREKRAVYARSILLAGLEMSSDSAAATRGDLRRAAAFVVACLSPDIPWERAVELYDEFAGTEPAGGTP